MSKAQKVVDRLVKIYGHPAQRDDAPFHVLVRTILSQNTNYRNTRIAYENLFSKFQTPEQIANADISELTALLKPAGLYNIKARRIKDMSKLIVEGHDLSKLVHKNVDVARNNLLKIKGIGPKTADCVLLFVGGHEVLPVDTHVFRVAKRLGLAPADANHEKVKVALERRIPPEKRGAAHIALISFGREFCRARNPRCDVCPLFDLCDFR